MKHISRITVLYTRDAVGLAVVGEAVGEAVGVVVGTVGEVVGALLGDPVGLVLGDLQSTPPAKSINNADSYNTLSIIRFILP